MSCFGANCVLLKDEALRRFRYTSDYIRRHHANENLQTSLTNTITP
jgi:hypothetical protein